MKKMNLIVAISITTAICCGAWYAIACAVGLCAWGGFAGCTSYFASGKQGAQGVKTALLTNLAGIAIAMASIFLGTMFPAIDKVGIWSGIVSFTIVMLMHTKLFNFTTGTFIGCFSTFAIGGNWKLLVVSIVLGELVGCACDLSGRWFYKAVTGNEP